NVTLQQHGFAVEARSECSRIVSAPRPGISERVHRLDNERKADFVVEDIVDVNHELYATIAKEPVEHQSKVQPKFRNRIFDVVLSYLRVARLREAAHLVPADHRAV